ncbi:bifunctional serine/threonine-protein kinase/formylglycine-generating enzyme family protein [Candidatus Uabimicrobium amorphum]|uniref:non-specific serine/threonine protein kinase n=1 Tax=Uabimicrobium amorphum TaxID=2596890 RepID=A0A5S9F504_UABAM|nr:bifunctional serine/threonine-protein kinase/formylglycine-generating enzyme family protein [Candidatus Uabimicrobium amorphum]BBM86102.1 hypothetical protein UABAM_04488 [Candidatus Uabimicrobium amorphum]
MNDFTDFKKWQLQDGSVLDTRQIFAKILANEIDTSVMCRSEKDDWQPLKVRFSIIGRYGILKELGQGAFGKVYLAFDARQTKSGKTGRLVAIKRPTKNVLDQYARQAGKHGTEGQMFSRMAIGQAFSQEALLTARLALNPYVVKVLDHDVSVPYMVLEFCNGGSLAERMTKPYTTEDVYKWAYEIASALLAAHSLTPDNMIHRDLKPQNILLSDGVIKVSDFGTAKMTYESESLRSLEGGYTPKYAAPEALNGKAYPATDMWSFAVILYRLISGHFPFTGDSMVQLMKRISCDEAVSLFETRKLNVADGVCQLVDACLQKDPAQRPSSKKCADFFANYIGANKSTPGSQSATASERHVRRAKPKFPHKETSRPRRKRPASSPKKPSRNLALIALSIAMIVATIILYSWLTRTPPQSTDSKTALQKPVQQIEGFDFLEEKSYSAGGQTHVVHEYRHQKTNMIFVLLPGGVFTMGDNKHKPTRKVELGSFLMSKYEVTQEVYQRFMGHNFSNFKGTNKPVEKVTWHQAKEFCKKTQLSLPTEAQWEYACRAGTTTTYYWGKADANEYCWYDANSNQQTHKVGQKKPNAFGLFDMNGNVWEWCNDWLGDYPAKYEIDPTGSRNGSSRIYRGGGYRNGRGEEYYEVRGLEYITVAYRGANPPSNFYENLGFRVCKLVSPAQRFVMIAGGVIWDKKTNLQWYVSSGDRNFSGAKRFINDLPGGGWRLPTVEEFRTISKDSKSRPGKKEPFAIFNASARLPWIEKGGVPHFLDLGNFTVGRANAEANHQTFAVRNKPPR